MYESSEYQDLSTSLIKDRRYNSIENELDRMHYLVQRRSDRLSIFGQSVLKQCATYEAAHRKSAAVAMACLERAHLLTQKYYHGEDLTEVEYAQLMDSWNDALRYWPFDGNNWSSLLQLVRIYVERGCIEFELGHHSNAMSDLRHASSALFLCKQPMVMLDHIGDQDLLLSMISLKTKLVSKFENPGEEVSRLFCELSQAFDIETLTLQSPDDIRRAVQIIRKLDSVGDMYQKEKQLEDRIEKKLHNLNYAVSEKIQLTFTQEEGRFYVASQGIDKGETVLLERAYSLVLFNEYMRSYCNYCHRATSNWWPCTRCTEVVFCSAECCSLATKLYHHDECGILGLILDSLESGFYTMAHVYRHCASFGLDLICASNIEQDRGEPFEMNQFFQTEAMQSKALVKQCETEKELLNRAMSSLLSHQGKRSSDHEHSMTSMAVTLVHYLIYKGKLSIEILQDKEQYACMLQCLAVAMNRVHTNGFAWAEEVTVPKNASSNGERSTEIVKVASCIFFVSSFFNHSCNPNTDWEISPSGLIYFVTRQAIQPNEPLTICYGPKRYNKFDLRQTRLRKDYCFYCQCVVCMQDASSLTTTLKCQNPSLHCSGPLVMNQFQACLQCGYRLSNQNRARFLTKIATRSSAAFLDTYRKLFTEKARFSAFNCFRGQRSRSFPIQEDESFSRLVANMSIDWLGSMKRTQISSSRVAKLEKHFFRYTKVIYAGSNHLLQKAVLLLKVYNEIGMPEKSFSLVELISCCVENIKPEMIDSKLVNLVYLLNYTALFYKQLTLKSDSNRSTLNNEANVAVLKLYSFLNSKLKDILQFDLEHDGELLRHTAKWSEDEDYIDEMINPDELYFREIFKRCLREVEPVSKLTG